jgi:CelD/BcsL family acetyltransferase involved in cellulose biosynthesis
MTIEIFSDISEYVALREGWNALVQDDPKSMMGLDSTATYEWFETILAAFPEAIHSRVIVLREGNETVGILPVILDHSSNLGLKLLLPTELYGGRNGPLLARPNPELLNALLLGLNRACPGWISLQLTMLTGSKNELLLRDACERAQYKIQEGSLKESPFFPIRDTPESFEATISKGLRQMLRTSANKFKALGQLQHKEYTNESGAEELLKAVLTVERKSWKHLAGTAITSNPRQERFYAELFPRAMKCGLLHAQVSLLDNRPIAYNFGVLNNGVFSCLKHSHDQALDKLSPSYLLNLSLINRLREKGIVGYDFMGMSDPHKLRWSDANGFYNRNTLVVYNKNTAGRLAFHAGHIKAGIAKLLKIQGRSSCQISD